MPLYLIVRSSKRSGTATKGLHEYMRKYRKRTHFNSTAPPSVLPCYSVEAPPEFDEEGKELGPDALVWKTYVREADRVDMELVDGWNRSLDTTLIFAALFAAIVSAFAIQGFKNLKQDPADASSQTLLTISQTLMLIANGSQLSNSRSGPALETETPVFKPSAKDICVNTLWFLALVLSVTTALISMLVKEWCLDFMSGRTGSPVAQARLRQQRWDGLVRWRARELTMLLPLLIHLSVLLFMIGLCVFISDVHYGVAIPVVLVTTIATGAYFACTILPLLYDFCPYSTVLSHSIKQSLRLCPKISRTDPVQDQVTASALRWMIVTCETPRSVDTALQSLAAANGTLPPDVLEKCNAWGMIKQRYESSDTSGPSDQSHAASLYKRGLEVYPIVRRTVDRLCYGGNDESKRLEQLVVGVQSTLNGLIHDVISGTRPLNSGTMHILTRCTLVGQHYLREGGITRPSGRYTHAVEVNPAELVNEIAELLERYLEGEDVIDPILYCTLSLGMAFVMCCNVARGLTDESRNVGYVLRLIRGYSVGRRETASLSFRQTIADNMILGTLWLLICCNHSDSKSSASRYATTETALEVLWAGLMKTIYSDRSALKRLEATCLTHGMLHLLANPNHYDLTPVDSKAIQNILVGALLNRDLTVKIQNLHHARYIQDISCNLIDITDVAAYTPQLLTALYNLWLYSPWDADYLLPTSEIYVFMVKHLCLSNYIDSPDVLNAYWILRYSPIPVCSPQLLHEISRHGIILHLSNAMDNDDPIKRAFATAQLWLFFNMSFREPDRSSPALNTLESALLQYTRVGGSLDKQEEVIEELEDKLYVHLVEQGEKIGIYLREYLYRVLEVMLQQRSALLPEFASGGLQGVADRLRGMNSFVNLETERSVAYPDVVFDSSGRVVS